jgi:hypothetical protein
MAALLLNAWELFELPYSSFKNIVWGELFNIRGEQDNKKQNWFIHIIHQVAQKKRLSMSQMVQSLKQQLQSGNNEKQTLNLDSNALLSLLELSFESISKDKEEEIPISRTAEMETDSPSDILSDPDQKEKGKKPEVTTSFDSKKQVSLPFENQKENDPSSGEFDLKEDLAVGLKGNEASVSIPLSKEKGSDTSNDLSSDLIQLEKPVSPQKEIYISNAGVVLLHPFLVELFHHLNWLKDKKDFEDEIFREKAVHMLGWLATGQEEIPENDLIVPKVLCGMALEYPVDRVVLLTEEDKLKGMRLLEAVLKHWQALKGTGPDGLRQAFLTRQGKLSRTGTDWKLHIENNTIDILLDRLPWGISMIKLPWMPQMLHVKWND